MKISELTMNKLRDLSILDVATKLGFTLKGTGQEGRRALCPYHDDKHPSLHFSRKKNIFKCFVCGAKGDLFKLVMDSENISFPDACQWLMKEFSIVDVPDPPIKAAAKPAVVEPVALDQRSLATNGTQEMPKVFKPLDQSLVTKSLSVKSTFCQSLVSTGLLTEPQMLQAADRYHLGLSKDGGVVFWEIDEQNQVHNGKIMYYQDTCHRDKSHTPTWVVAKLKSCGSLPSNVENPHCLFGLHLLNSHPDPLMGRGYLNVRATGGAVKSSHIGEDLNRVDASFTSFLRAEEKERLGFKGVSSLARSKGIAIVESEKTAVICSALFPEMLWMASGGKTMLNASLFAPLGDRRIILFPDTDESGETYKLWFSVAQEATKLYKSRIHVSNLLELHATPAQKTAKIDLVDFLYPNLQ